MTLVKKCLRLLINNKIMFVLFYDIKYIFTIKKTLWMHYIFRKKLIDVMLLVIYKHIYF